MSVNKNIFYSFLTQLPALVLGFGSSIFLTRILGAEGRGVYTIFYNDIQFLCLFFSFGLNTGIIYFLSSRKMAAARLAGLSIWLTLGSSALLCLVLLLAGSQSGGAFVFPDGYYSLFYLLYLTGSFGLSLLNVLISAIFQGVSNFRVVNFVSVFNSVLNFVFFLALYFLHRMYPEAITIGVKEVLLLSAGVLLLNSLLWVGLYAARIKAVPDLRISFGGDVNLLFSFAALIHLSNIINFFNYRLDIWVVEHFKKAEQLGVYSLSANLAQMFWMISVPISNVLLPHLSEKERSGAPPVFAFYSRLNSSLLLVLGAGAFLCAGLIPLIYGDDFSASVLPFRILLPGIVLSCLTKLLAAYVISRSKNWYNVIASSAGFVVTLTLDLWLIPSQGIFGASIATVCSYSVIFLLYFYFVYFRLKMPPGNHFIMTKADIVYLKSLMAKKN